MRVLLTGASGNLGRAATTHLVERGHEVMALSRRAGRAWPDGVHGMAVDLLTDDLAPAVGRADVVLHAASNTGRGMGRGDPEATRRLMAAARASGVGHLLFVSIVGIDRVPLPYYRRKLAQEALLAASGLPCTVFRATQFHEGIGGILTVVERWPLAPLPLGWLMQPVAVAEAAARAVELLEEGPCGRAPDFGGPEILTVGEMAAVWRQARGGPRAMALPLPGRLARALRRGLATTPVHREGRRTWSEYVASRASAPEAEAARGRVSSAP